MGYVDLDESVLVLERLPLNVLVGQSQTNVPLLRTGSAQYAVFMARYSVLPLDPIVVTLNFLSSSRSGFLSSGVAPFSLAATECFLQSVPVLPPRGPKSVMLSCALERWRVGGRMSSATK